MAKNVKTLSKSSEPILPSKDKTVVEEESRSKGSKIRKPSMHVDGTENPTKTKRSAIDKELRSLDNDSSEKDEESIPQHADRERISKKKVDLVVNVEELTYDEEPLTNIVTPSVTKRLQRRKGKAVVFEDSPSREVKRKYGGLKGTSSRRSIGKSHIGPTRSWIKVDTPTGKRKFVSSSESGFDVKKDRRVPLERELGKDSLKCKEVVELIEAAGLMKTVTHFGPCYESLVNEFMVTIPDGCDDTKSADYGKVYVRGNVVRFSPAVINKFIGRTGVPQAELEVTDDQAPGPATSKKSVIAQLKETCKEMEDPIRSSTTPKYKLETLVKVVMEEDKKEVVHDGDGNERIDDEDYDGENDVDEEKEDKGEEYALADSDS
ncbi:uncharacterized protein LOC127131589 [Lathyrus oleraceus]|uniref:uncharacterized protein LOC127131589 n=1 Tax=Pisum sativum TaxID=3888 RepID=UPI0021D0BC5D|nr:uncharacterized protein LOC127131589 [Pisum sativum]